MTASFTGPRLGMTQLQKEILVREFHVRSVRVLHHGDCQGSDAEADLIAASLGIERVAHPPTAAGLRAFCQCETILPPLPYLERNHRMVQATSMLFATPDAPEGRRSGTWATIRYATRQSMPVVIITRTGEILSA